MEATLTALADSAQSAYDQGRFETAAAFYHELETQGGELAAVSFNLGNCYTRMEQWGSARLYFERANALAPSDETRYNLNWVQQRLTDELPDPAPKLLDVLSIGLREFNGGHWMLTLGLVLALLSLVLLVLRKWNRGGKPLNWRWPLTTTVLAATLLVAHLVSLPKSDRAILTATNSYGYSEPNKTSATLLMLSEGSAGRIEKTVEGWYYLELGNGERAWFEQSQWSPVLKP